MAKISTIIGFATTTETSPDVFEEGIQEKSYICEIYRMQQSNMSETSVNPNLKLSNKVSILADDFLRNNHPKIRYIVLWNNKWKIPNLEIQDKRLILSVGEVYP